MISLVRSGPGIAGWGWVCFGFCVLPEFGFCGCDLFGVVDSWYLVSRLVLVFVWCELLGLGARLRWAGCWFGYCACDLG